MSGGRRREPRGAVVEGRTSPHGRLTQEQIETLETVYRETGNVTRASRSAGVTRETARRYLHRGRYAGATGPGPAPSPTKRPGIPPAMSHPGRVKLRLPASFAAASGLGVPVVQAASGSNGAEHTENVPPEPSEPSEPKAAPNGPERAKAAPEPAQERPEAWPANPGGGPVVPPARPALAAADPAHTADTARSEALRLLRSIRGGTFVLWLNRVNELLTHPRGADGLPVPGWKPALAALRLVRMADLRDVIELEQMLLGVGTDAPDVEGVRRAKESEELLVQALIAQRAAAAVKAQANAARRADPDDDGDDDDARPN